MTSSISDLWHCSRGWDTDRVGKGHRGLPGKVFFVYGRRGDAGKVMGRGYICKVKSHEKIIDYIGKFVQLTDEEKNAFEWRNVYPNTQ